MSSSVPCLCFLRLAFDLNTTEQISHTQTSSEPFSENLLWLPLSRWTSAEKVKGTYWYCWQGSTLWNGCWVLAANEWYFNPFSPLTVAEVISENLFKNEISNYHRSLESDQGWCICMLTSACCCCCEIPATMHRLFFKIFTIQPDMRRSSSNKQCSEINKNFRLQSHIWAPRSLCFSCAVKKIISPSNI